MRHAFFKSIAAGALAVACAPAAADTSGNLIDEFLATMAQGKSSTLVNIDNDTLLLNKNDGFYTSGARLTRQYALGDATQSTTFGWRIGQELYTASDIKLPPEFVGPPDHPYAGWLYGGFFKETRRNDGSYTRLGFDIGCLGPCAGGEWTQTNLHRLLRQPLPRGWRRQVNNELGAVLYADVAPARWVLSPSVDLTANLHARLGNIYTDAGAGIRLRAGQLNAMPDQPTLHGFIRLDTSAIGYNASLQGGYFSKDNPHTVKPKRFVGEAEIGIAWRQGPYGVDASVVRRSNEIRALANGVGAQNFVRLLFSYTP